jgi:hypothetical protein
MGSLLERRGFMFSGLPRICFARTGYGLTNAVYPSSSPSVSRIGSTRVTVSLRFPERCRKSLVRREIFASGWGPASCLSTNNIWLPCSEGNIAMPDALGIRTWSRNHSRGGRNRKATMSRTTMSYCQPPLGKSQKINRLSIKVYSIAFAP